MFVKDLYGKMRNIFDRLTYQFGGVLHPAIRIVCIISLDSLSPMPGV